MKSELQDCLDAAFDRCREADRIRVEPPPPQARHAENAAELLSAGTSVEEVVDSAVRDARRAHVRRATVLLATAIASLIGADNEQHQLNESSDETDALRFLATHRLQTADLLTSFAAIVASTHDLSIHEVTDRLDYVAGPLDKLAVAGVLETWRERLGQGHPAAEQLDRAGAFRMLANWNSHYVGG